MNNFTKMLINTALITTSLSIAFLALADKERYTLEYTSKDAKGPSLTNTDIKGQIFRNNIPRGYFHSKTDANGSFSFTNPFSSADHLEIIEIKGEEELKLKCHGHSTPNVRKIQIHCEPIGDIKP